MKEPRTFNKSLVYSFLVVHREPRCPPLLYVVVYPVRSPNAMGTPIPSHGNHTHTHTHVYTHTRHQITGALSSSSPVSVRAINHSSVSMGATPTPTPSSAHTCYVRFTTRSPHYLVKHAHREPQSPCTKRIQIIPSHTHTRTHPGASALDCGFGLVALVPEVGHALLLRVRVGVAPRVARLHLHCVGRKWMYVNESDGSFGSGRSGLTVCRRSQSVTRRPPLTWQLK